VIELDGALRRDDRVRVDRIGHFFGLVQQLEDSLGRGQGQLNRVGDAAQLHDRL